MTTSTDFRTIKFRGEYDFDFRYSVQQYASFQLNSKNIVGDQQFDIKIHQIEENRVR